MSNKLDNLLSRLQKVRKTGTNSWTACCPSREDRTPSLTIKLCDDGRILIHDFGGDETSDVLAAIGMELKDLMPENVGFHRKRPGRIPFNAMDVMYAIRGDLMTALIVCKDVQAGKVLTDEESLSFARLIGRVGMAIELAGGK